MTTILAAVVTWLPVALLWLTVRPGAEEQNGLPQGAQIMLAAFVMVLVSSLVNGYIGAKRALLLSDTLSVVGAILCCASAVASGFYIVTHLPA